MMLRKILSPCLLSLALVSIFTNASPAVGQNRQFHIDYTVEVSNPETSLFHVTAQVENINQPRLDLSLPVWTPGWYTIENYAKNILRFKITDKKGVALSHMMTRKQTWSVDTKNNRQIRVEFDYRADTLAVNQAVITKEFAFFTGTELFLMAEGHRTSPNTVHFVIPGGWKIISALKETSDPLIFTAPDYDTLVDSPTEIGHFDVTRFEVEGKPHYFVATPVGAYSSDKTQKFASLLAKVASTESALFGGLPYEKYLYFYFFVTKGDDLLEHSNSFVGIGGVSQPEEMIVGAAHEFFHLWNVKRIRPAEMWPYDYSNENETPLLWVSEGFTVYYANVAAYRAGLMTKKEFLGSAGGSIGGVENREARAYVSPAEASVSTWLGYDTPVAFSISYYTQGKNLAALLDLSIRHDTGGSASLDDLMRGLYREFYLRGKGFTTEDMIGVINRLTKRDYHDFFRRYVWGVEVPPYETIFGYAGLRVEKTIRKTINFGMGTKVSGGELLIYAVTPNLPAAAAGLLVGDVIEKVNDKDPLSFRWQMPGETVKMTIRRAGEKKDIPFKIGSRDEASYDLVESPQATPDQLKIREGWLTMSK